jgi:4a-hydroxytetrahydrobiopterin dehydratase
MKLASTEDLQSLLNQHNQWSLREGKLTRDWEFADFLEAISFVNKVAHLAEEANHHPDIDIRYNKVRLALISHDANGITSRDLAMVRKIGSDSKISTHLPKKVL